MYDFEHEGIYITGQGYFISEWNSKSRKYDVCSMEAQEIPLRLNTSVFLTDDVRLKHVFAPLIEEPIFEIIFHTDWWKDLMKEIKSKEWKAWVGDEKLKKDIDGDELEYLEVYQHITFSQKDSSFDGGSRWQFHGIGFPFIDQQNAQSSYLNVGDRQQYAIEFHSMADLMNIPLRVGHLSLYNEDIEDYKQQKILTVEENYLTLYELIHSIVWEMSFCGAGESKENFSESLTADVEEFHANPSAAVSYSSVQMNDFFEEMKLQGQEEQSIKAIDKLSKIFADIENIELRAKMTELLKSKVNL